MKVEPVVSGAGVAESRQPGAGTRADVRLMRSLLIGIFILMAVYALYFARAFFMPVILAFLLAPGTKAAAQNGTFVNPVAPEQFPCGAITVAPTPSPPKRPTSSWKSGRHLIPIGSRSRSPPAVNSCL